jgi:GTP-binding protein
VPRRGRTGSRRSREIPLEGLPVVAIVGRPNVGKSTLFNRVVGERTAIVEDRARTTRDRLYGATEWNGRRFVVVDTGGLERRPGDPIEEKVQEQARLAIDAADVIVFVVDAASGQTPSDVEAADLLRTARAPVLVAVNKADNEKRELEGAEFHRFGWEETYPISALHGRGVADLLDALVWALPPESEAEVERKRREAEAEEDAEAWADDLDADGTGVAWAEMPAPSAAVADGEAEEDDPDDEIDLEADDLDDDEDEDESAAVESRTRAAASMDAAAAAAAWDAQVAADRRKESGPVSISIVGRPNVGKSSLLNSLLGEERVIVSDIPGTTRDAIDTTLEWNGRTLRLIDTAGMRRRGKVAGGTASERFSALRALKAISRADVAVLVLDSGDGLTAQDAHVAGYVVEEGKALVVVLNKWDLVEKEPNTFDDYVRALRAQVPFLDFASVLSISAKTGQRVGRVLEAALDAAGEHRRRVPTGELNRMLSDAWYRHEAPMVKGKRPKFFYATQVAAGPPTFVVFARNADSVHFSYQRYLENQLRETFGFLGTPIRILFRERSRTELPFRRRARGRPSGPGRKSTAGRRPGGGNARRAASKRGR